MQWHDDDQPVAARCATSSGPAAGARSTAHTWSRSSASAPPFVYGTLVERPDHPLPTGSRSKDLRPQVLTIAPLRAPPACAGQVWRQSRREGQRGYDRASGEDGQAVRPDRSHVAHGQTRRRTQRSSGTRPASPMSSVRNTSSAWRPRRHWAASPPPTTWPGPSPSTPVTTADSSRARPRRSTAGWPWTDASRKGVLAVHIIDLTYVGLGIHEELAAYVADQQNYYEQEGVHVALRDGRAWDGGTAPAQAAGLSPARQVRRSLQERSRSGGRNAAHCPGRPLRRQGRAVNRSVYFVSGVKLQVEDSAFSPYPVETPGHDYASFLALGLVRLLLRTMACSAERTETITSPVPRVS
jgi:hypothetical protein